MDPWLGILLATVILVGALAVTGGRLARSQTRGVVLRLDVGDGPNVPLTVINAGRDPVFELEATLRFEGRASEPEQLMERHRRSLVLLPGERLAFPLPENMAGRQAAEFGAHIVRVRLDAVGRDATGRAVETRDVLDDPMSWIESERRSRSSPLGADAGSRWPANTPNAP